MIRDKLKEYLGFEGEVPERLWGEVHGLITYIENLDVTIKAKQRQKEAVIQHLKNALQC